MDAWDRLTDLQQGRDAGEWEESNQKIYMSTCIAHEHKQWHGEGLGLGINLKIKQNKTK